MGKKTLVWASCIAVAAFVACVFLYFLGRCSNNPPFSQPRGFTTVIPDQIPTDSPKESPSKRIPDAQADKAGDWDQYISLAKVDGLEAIARAKLELRPEDFEALLPHLVQVWADNEPLLAIRWLVEQNQRSDVSEAASSALIAAAFNKLGGTNPADALTAVAMLPTDDHKAALKWAGHGAVTEGKGRDLIEAARHLDSGMRMATEAFALESWVRVNPSDAVTAFETVVPPSDRTEPVRAQMAEAWMNLNPHAASSWWLDSAPNDERRSAIEQIIEIWATADPDAAAKWLNSIEIRSSEEKDAGIRALAYALADQDPQTALEWAKTIQNSFLREETLTLIMSTAPEQTFSPSSHRARLPKALFTTVAKFEQILGCRSETLFR